MQNGQLKPGYNVQVGTENNFVIGYDVFSNPTDTRTLKPHIENVEKRLNCKLKTVIADATVFGQIKSNQKFRRFNLCGKQKVETEWGLLMLGYNVKQLIRLMNA